MSVPFGTPLRSTLTGGYVRSPLPLESKAPRSVLGHRPEYANLWKVDENGNVQWVILAVDVFDLDAASDIIVVGSQNAADEPIVVAYDPADGSQLWSVAPFAAGLNGFPLVRVRNGAVFAGSPDLGADGALQKLAKSDGSVLHDYDPPTWTKSGGSKLYWKAFTEFAVASDDDVFVFDSVTGELVRVAPAGSAGATASGEDDNWGAQRASDGNVYHFSRIVNDLAGKEKAHIVRNDQGLTTRQVLEIKYDAGEPPSAIDAPTGVDPVVAINGGVTPTAVPPDNTWSDLDEQWDLVRHPDWSDEFNTDASWYLKSSALNQINRENEPISGVALQGDDVIVAGRFAPNAGDDTPLVRVDVNKTVTWQFDATFYTNAKARFYASHFARVDGTNFVIASGKVRDRSWIDGFTPPALA